MVRRIGISLLISAIALAPRIPLPIAVPDRRVDLRVEDMILVAVLYLWVIRLTLRPRIISSPIFRAFGVYLLVGALTSIIGVLVYRLDLLRTTLYFMKEVEYAALGLVVANQLQSETDVTWARNAFLGTVIANASWMGVQLSTGIFEPLFLVETPQGMYEAPGLLESYGPGLINEVGAFQTGQFFLFALMLSLAYTRSFTRRRGTILFGALSLLSGLCIMLSGSRGAVFGAVIGAGILVIRGGYRRGRSLCVLGVVLLGVVALLATVGETTPGRFTRERVEVGVVDRAINYWFPLATAAFPGILFGYGKGSLGYLTTLPHEFAHNYYLRIAIESGAVGLIAFAWVLREVVSSAGAAYKHGAFSIAGPIADATFAITIVRCVQAVADDVFIGVLVNELWWVFIGLTLAAARIKTSPAANSMIPP